MKVRRGLALAAWGVVAAGAAVVIPAAAAQAVTCTNMEGNASVTYDYAWVTDHNDDCGWMQVNHEYFPNGPGVWTGWFGGNLHHYETPRAAQLSIGGYYWQGAYRYTVYWRA